MSAETRGSVSGVWASLEGSVVNGLFPLHRCLGSSDHSGVFLTQSAKRAPSEVAIKLVPVIATPAELHLSRWLTAADLAHPHLLRIFEAGKCEVEGLHYLYAVMEYADQTLAQLLERRALSEDEAREMLAPTLSALSFLHQKKFVQGHLKPSNVLVVGDQLKLASDTNRIVDEIGERVGTLSVYHAPEARDGRCSTEGDIWALGVTMCEALTRRQPSGLRGGGDRVVLPPGFPPAFHELVARCLSRSPHDRPEVAELEAWLQGKPLAPAPTPIPDSEAMALLESPIPAPVTASTTAPVAQPPKPRALPLMLAAFAVFMLTWAGIRATRPSLPSIPPPPLAAPAREPVSETPRTPAPPVLREDPAPIPVSPAPVAMRAPAQAATDTPRSALHEVIPNVPLRASQTIRGTIRVSVRVIVDRDGAVFAALSDDPGPSRYFERLAIDAAKQWTFPPADSDAQRLMRVQFAFTRAGTTARAVPLR